MTYGRVHLALHTYDVTSYDVGTIFKEKNILISTEDNVDSGTSGTLRLSSLSFPRLEKQAHASGSIRHSVTTAGQVNGEHLI